MRKTFGAWGFVAVGVALTLTGCSAESSQDPGPGDGPTADEPSAPANRAPSQAGSPGAPGSPESPAPPGAAASPGAPAAPAASRVLARGQFVNKSYSGAGTALVVVGADNVPFLRLENIVISSGPALHVLLTKQASPSSKADVDQGSLDLGVLRATKGNLTYTIPAGTDVTAYSGVIVYCVDYSMVFTAAALTP